ncbi:hypothetical protein [Dongia sedimenti]|uniref:HdeA/HdeB family protein n=1 Tax=Dongia sedimenti TaxID=3064282 RepID=A0ABU0YQT7_9PROT|nr:hypothetical protein [Rhodospirillaceae bacterium R-7]
MRRIALAGSMLALTAGTAVAAMTNDMDLVYGKYQMAIRAAQLCRGAPDSDSAWRRWSSFLDDETHHELGAGERLTIIEGAKADVTYMVRRQGCDSAGVKDLLALYDAKLAGLLK